MAEKKKEELKSEKIRRENEEAEKEQREYAMYDLKVTAEERGYEVEEPQLAPENELREVPLDPDSPKSVNNEADEEKKSDKK